MTGKSEEGDSICEEKFEEEMSTSQEGSQDVAKGIYTNKTKELMPKEKNRKVWKGTAV